MIKCRLKKTVSMSCSSMHKDGREPKSESKRLVGVNESIAFARFHQKYIYSVYDVQSTV